MFFKTMHAVKKKTVFAQKYTFFERTSLPYRSTINNLTQSGLEPDY